MDYIFEEDSLDISSFLGKVFFNIEIASDKSFIQFITSDDQTYIMYHSQVCCEKVYVEDICGDIYDLIGTQILKADSSTNKSDNPLNKYSNYDESFTWTFYHLSTIKGSVTIRWYGQSNGYYSERVDIRLLKNYIYPF